MTAQAHEGPATATATGGPDLALRAGIAHCLEEPLADDCSSGSTDDAAPPRGMQYLEDGLLLVRNGHIAACGNASDLLPALDPALPVHDYRGKLIVPGFVDAHIHYPQTDMIASPGEQLIGWLNRYTFPAEARFGDIQHAREVAQFFLDELLRQGTTAALVFATVHPQSVDAIFEAAHARGLCLGAGKVLMDRHCPESVRDTPESGYQDSKALLERWHGKGRLRYAITPRFAPTSSHDQLTRAGDLAREFPDAYVHSHLAENLDEVAWVQSLFPACRSYLDVYDRYGLLRERAVYAHCLELDAQDRDRMAESGASIAFCPTSNLFLGNGMFDLEAAAGIPVALATDVGGGTSFGLLQTAAEGYKVLRQRGQTISAWRMLYLLTLGGARALHLHQEIGNFETGKAADLVVLDPRATPLLERRTDRADTLHELLFALIMLGDDRAVYATYLKGEQAQTRAN
ncbi:MAG: guanine deaminase [Gammaproteobacteria bacterium]